MKRKKYNRNFSKFIIYISYVLTITFLGLSYIYIDNEIVKTNSEIGILHENYVSNLNIVKELQSNREYLMSERYISEYLNNQMSVITPETLLIQIKVKE